MRRTVAIRAKGKTYSYPRPVLCLFCQQPLGAAAEQFCARCRELVAGVDWRVVYDRDQGLGALPANLIASYPADGLRLRIAPGLLDGGTRNAAEFAGAPPRPQASEIAQPARGEPPLPAAERTLI